jgi:hypothetical protein
LAIDEPPTSVLSIQLTCRLGSDGVITEKQVLAFGIGMLVALVFNFVPTMIA